MEHEVEKRRPAAGNRREGPCLRCHLQTAGREQAPKDETLPSAATDITLDVRASDTLFTADDAVLPWTAVGGTMPLGSVLPAGQYKQWQATLTTTNNTQTPLLHEVRLYYF